MPQLDLDHLFRVEARGGDVSASARADDGDGDAPAESVLLRVRDGAGLAELLCAALRRDGSTKGSSNPKATAEAEAVTRKQGAGAPWAGSRRLAATASKSAVVIGVLPAVGKVVVAKERRARARAPGRVAVARAWRRPAGGARVFASEAAGPEPVSPKVSCFGAVLPVPETPPPGRREGGDEEPGGCWASVSVALRGLCCSCSSNHCEDQPGVTSESDWKATAPEPLAAAAMSPPRPVAGLGDVKRLASRRWPETMAEEGRSSV